MRVLHLSTSDTNGGAARAAYRLHSGLRSNGVDSRMLVQNKNSNDDHVYGPEGMIENIKSKLRPRFDKLPLKWYPDRDPEIFSPAWTPERRAKQIAKHDPDIVHLHWVSDGFIRPETIAKIDVPVVWTLHDMWPFTGGCHISNSCMKYKSSCGSCPHLGSDDDTDLSYSIFMRKKEAWNDLNFNIIGPSRWIANSAKKSSLFSDKKITIIPNGLNISKYSPKKMGVEKDRINIDFDKKLVCFGSSHQANYKGYDLLYDSLRYINNHLESVQLISFGPDVADEFQSNLPIQELGYLEDEPLRALYSVVDVIVVPSRIESFGQIISESLASGTPVVAFDATGPQDIIDHKETGYLATPYDPKDLAKGIKWVITDQSRNEQLGRQAREAAEQRFAIERVTGQHQELYQDIIA